MARILPERQDYYLYSLPIQHTQQPFEMYYATVGFILQSGWPPLDNFQLPLCTNQ
jgi:hypothetical protein